jgi:hypothetical protein
MLINLSNHPLNQWKPNQIQSAEAVYTRVIDIPFPAVEPSASEDEVLKLSSEYVNKCCDILSKYGNQNNAVHLMGELTFTLAVASGLIKRNIKCIASTTNRIVEEDGVRKITIFNFVRFREYKLL